MWLYVSVAVLLVCFFSTIEAANIRAKSLQCGDLVCIKDQFEAALAKDGYIHLGQEHEKHFGRAIQVQLQRLLFFMGIGHGSTPDVVEHVQLELSENQLQLRLIGFIDKTKAGVAFNVSQDAKSLPGYIRLEHIYSLEEQSFIGISCGATFQSRFNSHPTELSIDSAARVMTLDQKGVKFPKFIRFLQDWDILEFGVVGSTRHTIQGNVALREHGARRIGFKAETEFDVYTGFLSHELTNVPGIGYFSRVRLPIDESLIEIETIPFNCAVVEHVVSRKMCQRAVKMGNPRFGYALREGSWEPYVIIGFDIGYGDTIPAHLTNALVNGQSLSLALNDIEFKHFVIEIAKFQVSWAVASPHQLEFGIAGEVSLELFKKTFVFVTEVAFPIVGTVSIALHKIGMSRVLGKLPLWIGNLQAEGEFFEGVLPIAGVFGGEVHIGWEPRPDDEDTRLKALALVNVGPFEPTETFFYAKFSPITIQSLLNMFVGHTRWQMPSFIGSTGIKGLDERHGRLTLRRVKDDLNQTQMVLAPKHFPENPEQFIVTFAPVAMETSIIFEIDSTAIIQPGVTVIGQVNVLGVAARLYARVDVLHLGAELDLELDPVRLGNGLVTLTAADIQSERVPDYLRSAGPNMYLAFQAIPSRHSWPSPEFRLSGALEVFGARVGLDVEVSKYGFHFKTEVNVWDWFVAKCIIEVKCHNGGLGNGVRVYGEVTVDSLKQLAKGFFNKVLKKMLGVAPWEKVIEKQEIIDRDADKRRLGFKGKMKKFGKSLKKLGKKLVSPITKIQLLSVKFDLNNANPDKSIPVFTEFQITLFGIHFVKYKSKVRTLSFDKPLQLQEEDQLVQDTIEELEECLADCEAQDESCLARVHECATTDK